MADQEHSLRTILLHFAAQVYQSEIGIWNRKGKTCPNATFGGAISDRLPVPLRAIRCRVGERVARRARA